MTSTNNNNPSLEEPDKYSKPLEKWLRGLRVRYPEFFKEVDKHG